MPAKLILTAVAVAVILVAGAAAMDAGVHNVGQSQSFTESFTPSAGDVTELQQSNLDSVRYFYSSNVTVRNASGVVMAPGEDYDWIRSNGTLRTLAGGRLAGDVSGDVDYGYRVTSENIKNVTDMTAGQFEVARFFVFVLVVGFIVVGVRALGVV